jgi:hypothetical protein
VVRLWLTAHAAVGEMPWKAFPFKDPRIAHLAHMYSISGIPSLVIIGPDGKIITQHGRERVSGDPDGSDFPWYPSARRQQQCEKALSDYKMTLASQLVPLAVGEKVTWDGEHELIPRGEVGVVIEVRADGKRVVQFPNATKPIRPANLTSVEQTKPADPATAVDQWLHSRGHSHYTAAICDAFSQAGFPQAEWLLELQQMSPVDLDLFLANLTSVEIAVQTAKPGLATVHITKDKAKGFGMHISDEGVVECFNGGAAKVRRMHAPPLTHSSRAARWRWQRPATSDLHASNRRSSKERRFHPFEGRMDSRITQVPITQTALH